MTTMLAYLSSSFRRSQSQEPTVPNVSATSFANISPRNITEEQVLQLMDSDVNPFNGEAYSVAYKAMLHTRKALPVYNELSSFLEMFQTQQIMLLMGETGSGKSTQIPQFVAYSDMPHLTGKMVAVTQPRKIAATSISERVAKEMDVTHGEEVGYAVRFEENWKDGTTFLKYMTDGLLLHEAMHDRDLSKYSTIILDEAQERSHSTDILMSLLKDIVRRRTDLKVIIMSAIDNPRFREYFGLHQNNLLSIPGRTYPVEEIYADWDTAKFVDAAIDKVCSIHRTEDPGDILVFLTGAKEIDDACQRIETQLSRQSLLDPGRFGPVSCVRLFAALPVEEQEKVFHDPPEPLAPGGAPGRKIIVSTNIAETSLTIDGVVYVVDSGHEKSEMFDPATGIESLKDRMISKASAQQRAGRAGRTKPGKCFRMYTREQFGAFDDHTYPQILRCNLDTIVLMLIKLGIRDILRFDFIERPNPYSVRHALDLLISLGAINEHSHEITEHGSIMADFPLKPQMSKALVSSVEHNCTSDIVTIAAMTYAGTVWFRPVKLAKEADAAKARFASPQGDHMTLLNVYHQYTLNKADEKWAWENYLSRYVLTIAEDIRIQLKQLMVQHSLPLVKSPHAMNDPSRHRDIGKALLCGFFGQVAQRNVGKKGYKTSSGEEVLLHASCLLLRSNPNATLVMYDKILHTTGRFMLTVSVIERQWLSALRPHLVVAHSGDSQSRTQQISRPKNIGRRHVEHRKVKKV